jgi:DNA mismatch repair protein MSH2
VELATHMRFNSSALRALSLFPESSSSSSSTAVGSRRGRRGGGATSLFGVLNRCATATGVHTLRAWIRRPCAVPATIVARHDAVDALVAGSVHRADIVESALK